MPHTLAVSITDRTVPIILGLVRDSRLELDFQSMQLEEIFLRQMTEAAFDVAECSLASYIIARGRGDDRLIGIPVFLSREFRHNALYVRSGDSYGDFASLRGTRLGLPEYQMTAAVWVRAILREAGVDPSDIDWVTYRPERIPIPSPARAGVAPDAFSALKSGEVEAILSARRPPANLLPLDGSAGTFRRLFADPWAEERAYYRRTHTFPIMHLVVVRSSVVRADATVPAILYDLFVEAKQRAYADLRETVYLSSATPFLTSSVEGTVGLLGPDPWRYGIDGNWEQLETFMDALIGDGLLERRLSREDLFAPAVLGT